MTTKEVYQELALIISIALLGSILVTSCTISFQNISTHGTATDLVDENQSPSTTANPNISVPITPGL